ncbi:MAG: hypothetical protein NVS2B12_21240 [Ktedonobacteraceae bacterium]
MSHISHTEAEAKKYRYADIMLEHLPVGVAVYDEHEFRLLEANSLFLAYVDPFLAPQLQHGQVIGHTLTEFDPCLQPLCSIETFRSVSQSGHAMRGEAQRISSARTQDKLTYWDWTLNRVKDPDSGQYRLLQTITDVTRQMQARQETLQAWIECHQANSEVEAERKRLEVIEIVARGVRESMDTERIGKIAIDAIQAHYQPSLVAIHIDNQSQRVYELLCINALPHTEHVVHRLLQVPYSNSFVLTAAEHGRQPLVIEDLQVEATEWKLDERHPLLEANLRGVVCVPLWFGERCEGALTACFDETISPNSPITRALLGAGTHIAAALAQARLLMDVKSGQLHLRTVLDQLPEGILMADIVSGSIDYANPAAAQLLKMPLSRLAGAPVHQFTSDYVSGETNDEGQPISPWNFFLIQALSGETVRSKEAVLILPDGSRVAMLISGAPLYTTFEGQSVMTGAVIVFQDITVQKSIEQHKSEFLAIANHELRTPITIIQGFAELLKMAETAENPLHDFTRSALAHIIDQSEYLSLLIEAMLDISKIEQQQFELNMASHNLLTLLIDIVKGQQIAAKNHNFRLQLNGLQEQDKVIGIFDKQRITQVISNLINNAVKYSPDGGVVEIGIRVVADKRRPGEYREALMWVKDQGMGIAPNDISHVFERFYRASTLDGYLSGFGIGLYVVREVMTRHGGRVWVESVKGAGSTFYAWLPLRSNQA